jgi:hypothetical protein
MVKELDGNIYVRPSTPGQPAPQLLTWSPAQTDTCSLTFTTLQDFRKVASGFEASGTQLDRSPRSVFRSWDLGRYDLQPDSGLPKNRVQLPADVRKLLNWTEQDAQWPGAYPHRN